MDEDGAIGEVLHELIDAWNRGDARRFAALFSPSAEYVTATGQRCRGPNEIADLVRTARSISSIGLVGRPSMSHEDKVGTLQFAWATVGGDVLRRGVITCFLTRRGTRWLVDRLENDESDPTLEEGDPLVR